VPHSLAMRNAALNAVCVSSGAGYFALFAGDPNAGGVELSGGLYARQQSTPPSATTGSVPWPSVVFQVPGGGTHPTHWARFTTSSGGSFYDSGVLPGSPTPGETYNSPGTLTLTLVTDMPA
jgi:hypothetical protein